MTSCPDWQELARRGDAFLVEGSAVRRGALRHIETCPRCRRSALRLDPTLAVAKLAPAKVSAEDVETVRRQVEALRRVRAIETGARRPSLANVALVVLLIGLGFFLPGGSVEHATRDARVAAIAEETAERHPAGALFDETNRHSAASLAVVESISPSTARIYQLDQPDFPFVMIVDESIDL